MFIITLMFIRALSADDNIDEENSDYMLSPSDVVTITVFGEEDLSAPSQRINASGQVRIGLIGTVQVVGMTLREAETSIEHRYIQERYLRNPQVTMQVIEYAAQYVVFLGEVSSPGRLKFEDETNRMSLVDGISSVGGFTGIANSDSVRITRRNEDGSEVSSIIDVDALLKGRIDKVPKEYRYLIPGDVVHVPERLF